MSENPFLQQLLALPSVPYALLSPDQRWVAFMWYRMHENVDVFVVPCDPNVTPENMRQVVIRLGDYHIPYELLVFEDEGHGIQKPANQARLYTRLGDFFERALA
jgi:hypothetical protein